MKFFATSELDKTVGDKLTAAQNIIASKISSTINNKNYGDGIMDWDYVSIAMTPDTYNAGFFNERTLYSKKNKTTDFRLKIDYDTLLKANEQETFRLICDSILRSVAIAESKKIKDFDFNAFRKDLTDLFQQEGWI